MTTGRHLYFSHLGISSVRRKGPDVGQVRWAYCEDRPLFSRNQTVESFHGDGKVVAFCLWWPHFHHNELHANAAAAGAPPAKGRVGQRPTVVAFARWVSLYVSFAHHMNSSSGVSIGVPANSLQLTPSRSYIIVSKIEGDAGHSGKVKYCL
jgi:hypothetical protein